MDSNTFSNEAQRRLEKIWEEVDKATVRQRLYRAPAWNVLKGRAIIAKIANIRDFCEFGTNFHCTSKIFSIEI